MLREGLEEEIGALRVLLLSVVGPGGGACGRYATIRAKNRYLEANRALGSRSARWD